LVFFVLKRLSARSGRGRPGRIDGIVGGSLSRVNVGYDEDASDEKFRCDSKLYQQISFPTENFIPD
jgi:hypothetical protein